MDVVNCTRSICPINQLCVCIIPYLPVLQVSLAGIPIVSFSLVTGARTFPAKLHKFLWLICFLNIQILLLLTFRRPGFISTLFLLPSVAQSYFCSYLLTYYIIANTTTTFYWTTDEQMRLHFFDSLNYTIIIVNEIYYK